MGIVYEAFDRERQAHVALKTLAKLSAPGLYRFKNEFRALSDVRHPNLVTLYELFSDEDRWYCTMELIEGQPFNRWVRPASGQSVEEARLRATLPQLCSALDAIHGAGKLHRDIKPSNVLVTPTGRRPNRWWVKPPPRPATCTRWA